MEPTYGELAKALAALGFKNRSNQKVFFYAHEPSGAEVVLPLKESSTIIHKEKFASLSWRLEGFGVLENENDLGKMIEQFRMKEHKAVAQA